MSPAAIAAFAPGRVNLIGEHTDYNDGLALPFALTEGVTVTATPIDGDQVRARALDLGEDDVFPVASPGASGGWRAYVRGGVAELQLAGVPLRPVQLSITGDVPRGAGLGSSAALEVALCLALIAAADAQAPGVVELSRICQRIEHQWVGAQTGLLDQLASLAASSGQALLIDFRSLEREPIPLRLGDHRLILLDSGQRRQNADSVYNRRREECFEAAHRMGKESLRDTQIQDLHLLPEPLARRARHVIAESGRVEQAATALRTGDMAKLGRLLTISHASLRDDYEVSTEAVERTVTSLLDAGALGARMLGGGSGGYVLALVRGDAELPAGARALSAGPGAHLRAAG